MELKEQIKANRERLGLSQGDLAERIYVSRQTISNWETDRTYPDVQSLLLLSDVFGTSIDELVKGDMKEMENALKKEWKKMRMLTLAGWTLASVGVACVVAGFAIKTESSSILPGFTEGELLGLIAFLLLWAFGVALLAMVDKMKNANDLVTLRDIVVFSRGEQPVPDKSAFGRRHPLFLALLKMSIGAVAGAAIGILITSVL